MNKTTIVLIACVATAAGSASARDIPVKIDWLGIQPTSINITGTSGFPSIDYDPLTKKFEGTLTVNGNAPERRTFIIRYNGYNHRLDVRVHRFLDKIEFDVKMQPAQSCTGRKVLDVGKKSASMPDALTGTIAAGQLLSIASPNNCDKTQEWNAIQARYRQNVRLMHLSNGLFLVTPQFAEAYREGAQGLAANGRTRVNSRDIEGEIAQYAKQEAELEAVQFRIARDQATDKKNFALAAAVSDAMYQRTLAGEAVEAAYRKEGMLQQKLAEDTIYLKNVAAGRGQTTEGY